jgi:membrane fusion protein (multidrug efflux system)
MMNFFSDLSTNRKKQIITGSGSVLLVLVLVGIVKFFQIRAAIAQHENMVMPPEAVTSSIAEAKEWQDTLRAVGNLVAYQGAMLGAEAAGTIVKIGFESGGEVKAGDFLLEIDASVEEAQLAGAVAVSRRAQSAFERTERLRKDLAVSQDALEAAQESLSRAKAEEAALRATLAKKRIAAPFSGTLGVRQVQLGQYVSPGTALVPLYALNPMYIDFAVPQNALGLLTPGQKLRFNVDAFVDREFEGIVSTISPQVDNATRTVAVRAAVQNPLGELRSGMFAHVRLNVGAKRQLLTLPQTAIIHAPYGDSVWVLKKAEAGPRDVEQVIVQLGNRRGDEIAVLSGLEPGAEVVASGSFKLRPGVKVVVDNSRAPAVSAEPSPADT